jgi:hypothetical protein
MPGPMDKGFAGPHGPAAASGAVSSAPPPSAPAASAGQKQSFTLAEVQAQVAAAVTQLTQRFCTRSEVEDRIDMKVPPEISGMRNVPDGGVPRKHVGYLQINNMGGEPSTAYWGDGPEGGDGGGLNLSLFDFGYSVTDADRRQITVQDGVFRIGQESRTVAAEVLTVSASPYRVYLSYPRGGTPVIEGSSNLNDTLPGADVFKVLLYTFTLSEDSGAVTLDRIHHLGSVQVGNVWA